MRYHALAVDYDGTIAHHGVVDESTTAAMQRLKNSGRRLFLVTGRELEELLQIYPHVQIFDRIVAENGGLIYHPATKEIRVLADPPPQDLIQELHRRHVKALSVGHAIIATVEPYHKAALAAIHDLGLEYQVIFNKGCVMLLPSGVNKATGLSAVLAEVGLSRHNVVGAGDAENDHAFLALCECAVAVANALPTLKERADFVTNSPHGIGIVELIDGLLKDELAQVSRKLCRHDISIGINESGEKESVDLCGAGVLVCGTSGSGKSTITTGLLERLVAVGYQFVTIDPEGDYASIEFAVSLGTAQREPSVDEVLEVLKDPVDNVVVNLLGVALERRPAYCDELLFRLLDLRAKKGRPHWIVIDEAHHLLPASWQPSATHLPADMGGAMYITVHPGSVSRRILETIDLVLFVGSTPEKTLREFCTAIERQPPHIPWTGNLAPGDAILLRTATDSIQLVHTEPPKTERKRHSRKYTEGNLGAERSFYFRGPEGKLNLKASNLMLFLQMADGVDDDTWEFHRHRKEYSRWLRNEIKDLQLASDVEIIESDEKLSPRESRAAVRTSIESRYTLPEDKASGTVD